MIIPRVKVNWSGGKDSTASVILNVAEGFDVVAVSYVPYFDSCTPLIMPEHLEFINQTADTFRSWGVDVHILHGLTYYDYVLTQSIRGVNKGLIRGFPIPLRGMCGFKRDSKVKTLEKAYVGPYHWIDLGIAADETDRQRQLSVKRRSILVQKGYTEVMARQLCLDNGLLSPIYNCRARDGCALCPFASVSERNAWFDAYPGIRDKLLALQAIVQELRPDHSPLRGHQWFEV